MKPTFKATILFLIFICLPFLLLSQKKKQDNQKKAKINLFEYKKNAEKYFDSLKSKQESSKFFAEGGEYSNYKHFLDFWEPRLTPTGDFITYYNAFAAFYSRTGKSNLRMANTDPWHEIGPMFWDSTLDSRLLGIGPMEFISIFDNGTNAGTKYMLAGSLAGGLFYSRDAGEHWQNAGTDSKWAQSGCSWATFHPTNHSTWFASSSGNSGSGQSLPIGKTGGIYRTNDEGAVWDHIADYTNLKDYKTIIFKLLIDPVNPKTLYAATSDGIYRSDNCDEPDPAWGKILDGVVYDLEMKPNDHRTLYATVFGKINSSAVSPKWYIAISSDVGLTWAALTSQPPVNLLHFNDSDSLKSVFTKSFTIEVSKAKPENLYCLVNNLTNSMLYYYVFTHPGWQRIGTNFTFSVSYGGGHGFGVDQAGDGNEIFFADGTSARKINILTPVDFQIPNSHDDVEDIVCHPYNPNEVWLANHGGIDKSIDRTTFRTKRNGLGVAQVWRMAASYSSPDYIMLGLDHDGTILSTTPYRQGWPPTWMFILPGDGIRPLIDNKEPKYMWASNCQGNWVFSELYFKWIDDGIFGQHQELTPIECNPTEWSVEGVLNKVDPSIIYRIWHDANEQKDVIVRSFDRGKHNDIIGKYTYIWELFTPGNNKDYLLISQRDDAWVWHLWRTKNATAVPGSSVVWEELNLPRPGWIASVCFDNYNPDIVYLAYKNSLDETRWPLARNMVYKIDYTNQNYLNVRNLTGNLPFTYTSSDCLAIEKGSNGGVYLSTDFGVFYTNNSMISNSMNDWQQFGGDLPHVVGTSLEINYPINKIRIGTFGRGVWEHSLFCPQDADLNETGTYTGNKFLEASDNLYSSATISKSVKVSYRSGNNITLKPGFSAINGCEFKAFIHPCDKPGNSFDPNSNP